MKKEGKSSEGMRWIGRDGIGGERKQEGGMIGRVLGKGFDDWNKDILRV